VVTMLLRLKLAWVALRWPAFTKWALDSAAGECLVGRRYTWGQPALNRQTLVAKRIATLIDTKGEQSLDT